MKSLVASIAELAEHYCDVPMLARTHGQPASPTTMGKEMANFAYHLASHLQKVCLQVTLLRHKLGFTTDQGCSYLWQDGRSCRELQCSFGRLPLS